MIKNKSIKKISNQIKFDEEEIFIKDLGSTKGTWLFVINPVKLYEESEFRNCKNNYKIININAENNIFEVVRENGIKVIPKEGTINIGLTEESEQIPLVGSEPLYANISFNKKKNLMLSPFVKDGS